MRRDISQGIRLRKTWSKSYKKIDCHIWTSNDLCSLFSWLLLLPFTSPPVYGEADTSFKKYRVVKINLQRLEATTSSEVQVIMFYVFVNLCPLLMWLLTMLFVSKLHHFRLLYSFPAWYYLSFDFILLAASPCLISSVTIHLLHKFLSLLKGPKF